MTTKSSRNSDKNDKKVGLRNAMKKLYKYSQNSALIFPSFFEAKSGRGKWRRGKRERERVRARARERVKAHEGLQKLDVQLKLTNSNRLPFQGNLKNTELMI